MTVTANPMLNATDTTNGYTLDKTQIADDAAGDGQLYAVGGAFAGRERGTAERTRHQRRSGQPADLGQRPARYLEHLSGERRRRHATCSTARARAADTSQRYNFNIGGGSTSGSLGWSATIGGANPASTSVYGSNGNSLPSPPPEFLQELRVNTSMYDAQQGATSGAQIDANTIDGHQPVSWAGLRELSPTTR